MSATIFDRRLVTQRRKDLNLPVEVAAVQARVSVWHLLHIERGDRLPSVPVMIRLAAVLGCRPGDFFTDADESAA